MGACGCEVKKRSSPPPLLLRRNGGGGPPECGSGGGGGNNGGPFIIGPAPGPPGSGGRSAVCKKQNDFTDFSNVKIQNNLQEV